MSGSGTVSPLAPAAFPKLPEIDGVRFSAAEAGIKYRNRLDVMLAELAPGSTVAGVFTRSATRSAPVLWCQEILGQIGRGADGPGGFAIVVNSGNSNAFTGRRGDGSVVATVDAASDTLGIPREHVFLASTGVIGEPLPHERITDAMEGLRDSLHSGAIDLAAKAIMTTDTFPKGAEARVDLDGVPVRIAGIAKGSGMIAPDMATMLVFIFTDADISQPVLQDMVSRINETTFNSITVDGDTSTSDSLVMAATGRAEMPSIEDASDPRAETFEAGLRTVMLDLAHQVVRDGEGATKFVEIHVTGAESAAAARSLRYCPHAGKYRP